MEAQLDVESDRQVRRFKSAVRSTFPRKLTRYALVICLAALTMPLHSVWAQAPQAERAELHTSETFLGLATIPLWDGTPPGAVGNRFTDFPTLSVFRPFPGRENGTAVIVAPGGAYLGLAADMEGRQVADWFTTRGVVAFVLKYRLGRDYVYPVPLQDAQRAVRLIRSRAKEFGIIPNRIGMIGFSAGGHLAAMTGTMFDEGKSEATDSVDRASSRPDFLVLGYPWLNAMEPSQQGFIPAYCKVLRIEDDAKCKSIAQLYTPELLVTAHTPPTFIFHTSDDAVVPVDASVTFYRALHSAGVPAEMHIFAHGPHGVGLGAGDPALDLWPVLLEAWLRGLQLLTPDSSLHAQ